MKPIRLLLSFSALAALVIKTSGTQYVFSDCEHSQRNGVGVRTLMGGLDTNELNVEDRELSQ